MSRRRHLESAERGVALAADLDPILAEAVTAVVERLRAEPDPVARARAVTRLIGTVRDGYLIDLLSPVRAAVIRDMRYPEGYQPGSVPAASWEEIGHALGITANRAYKIAGFPGDREGPRATGRPAKSPAGRED